MKIFLDYNKEIVLICFVWIRTNKAVKCSYLPLSNMCVKLKMGLLLLIFQSNTNVNYISVFVWRIHQGHNFDICMLWYSRFYVLIILLQTNCNHARPIYLNRQHTIYMKNLFR